MRLNFGKIQVDVKKDSIYIPGTNHIGDILLYPWMFVKKKHHLSGRVHRGFYREYLRHRDDILKAVKAECGMKLTIGGHSLGGFWAKMLALDLIELGYDVSVKVKGDPRTGNREFAEYLNSRVVNMRRLKYGGDIVTILPPFYADEKGQEHIGPDRKWWQIIKMFTDHIGYWK